MYETLINKKPNDPLYSYRLARCCYELKDWKNTIKYFEISGTKYPLSQWYLAEAYFNDYRFEDAVTTFESFKATLQPDDKRLQEIEEQMHRAEVAAKLMVRVEDITIIDSIITDKNNFLKNYNINPELGSIRQSILKTGNPATTDQIIYATQRGDRQIYSDTLNGNSDIFSSYRLMDKWSDPVSISEAVNTPANENYPFLLPDGLTLYYASDGESSMGGFDIFITKYSSVSQGFLNPDNIGFPFNSPANDYMMAIDEANKTGWFATDRNQKAGKLIIYKFETGEKKLVRTSNTDSLRLVAQLKTYRKTINYQNINYTLVSNTVADTVSNFSLIINDNLVYTKTGDFQNPKALSLWNEYVKQENFYESELNMLNELRLKYNDQKSDKNKTGNQILNKETEVNSLYKSLQEKLMIIRNEEILFLSVKKKN